MRIGDDSATAADLVERSLFVHAIALHPLCSLTGGLGARVRVRYRVRENRCVLCVCVRERERERLSLCVCSTCNVVSPIDFFAAIIEYSEFHVSILVQCRAFFLTLYRHIHILAQKSFYRTALELCKVHYWYL